MPVLFKDSELSVYSSDLEVESDGRDASVRERLCLKSHADRHCSSSIRRSAPYQLSRHKHSFLQGGMCEHCKYLKHFPSPNGYRHQALDANPERLSSASVSSMTRLKSEPNSPHQQKMCSPHSYAHHKQPQCCHCKCQQRKDHKQQNPRILLEKLLSEQSLIQEAVRRLQARTSQEQSMCSAQKLFSLLRVSDMATDEDSNDQFSSRQTPFSVAMSESEDDSLSQHSVDL